MAQRISRAKQQHQVRPARRSRCRRPPSATQRLGSVLHVLYLIFNEGYASSAGPNWRARTCRGEAIRLTRLLHRLLPDDAEVAGLLALMLLTDARRPAAPAPDGELVPLDRAGPHAAGIARLIDEGVALVSARAPARARSGAYQLQAAIAAVHDEAPRAADTDWPEILALYGLLDASTGNPMVTLNRAVAVAMVHGPGAGLALLDTVADDARRTPPAARRTGPSARASGPDGRGGHGVQRGRRRATNLPEQHYLTTQAARLRAGIADPPEPL